MQVETYECEEVANEPLEIEEAAIALINKLELDGQKTLITQNTETNRETRCPYRQMKQDELFVYRQLCPHQVTVERYASSPMPIRVLQILEHAKSLDMFKVIQVWSAAAEVKDPVLVAYNTENIHGSNVVPYILARWGEHLDEMPALIKRSLQAWKAKARATFATIKQQVALDEALVDSAGIEVALKRNMPSYYGYS